MLLLNLSGINQPSPHFSLACQNQVQSTKSTDTNNLILWISFKLFKTIKNFVFCLFFSLQIIIDTEFTYKNKWLIFPPFFGTSLQGFYYTRYALKCRVVQDYLLSICYVQNILLNVCSQEAISLRNGTKGLRVYRKARLLVQSDQSKIQGTGGNLVEDDKTRKEFTSF